jgi:hypothetical protein
VARAKPSTSRSHHDGRTQRSCWQAQSQVLAGGWNSTVGTGRRRLRCGSQASRSRFQEEPSCRTFVATCFRNSGVSKRLAPSSRQQHPLPATHANVSYSDSEPEPAVSGHQRMVGCRAKCNRCHSGIYATNMTPASVRRRTGASKPFRQAGLWFLIFSIYARVLTCDSIGATSPE